jgi:hypothetical protein
MVSSKLSHVMLLRSRLLLRRPCFPRRLEASASARSPSARTPRRSTQSSIRSRPRSPHLPRPSSRRFSTTSGTSTTSVGARTRHSLMACKRSATTSARSPTSYASVRSPRRRQHHPSPSRKRRASTAPSVVASSQARHVSLAPPQPLRRVRLNRSVSQSRSPRRPCGRARRRRIRCRR